MSEPPRIQRSDSKPGRDMTDSPVVEKTKSGRPTYFHLLWDHELDNLAPILDAILSRREQVLAHWHRLYVLHFGDSRSLSDREFMEIFGAESGGDYRRPADQGRR